MPNIVLTKADIKAMKKLMRQDTRKLVRAQEQRKKKRTRASKKK